jgi:hypothetical protein
MQTTIYGISSTISGEVLRQLAGIDTVRRVTFSAATHTLLLELDEPIELEELYARLAQLGCVPADAILQ